MWNGTAWAAQSSGSTVYFYGVWGGDANSIWAVSYGGSILKWNGTAWAAQSSGNTQILRSVWGNDGSNIWVMGGYGTILQYVP